MQSSSSLPVTNGRRSLVLAVVVAVLASLALALNGNTPAKAADSTLLSYDKPGTASTYQDANSCVGCTPAKAFDHDPATRWATSDSDGWVDPGWISVDLGATAHITQVVLQWDPAYATSYEIQTSPDGNDWTSIYSTTAGKGFKETLDIEGDGRYVRMYGTARSNGYGYSLWGFDVYGTGGDPTPPPAAPPAPNDPPQLVWSDEFDGPAGSKPDTAKWFQDTGRGENGELEEYTDGDNTTMDGEGNLVIEARRRPTARTPRAVSTPRSH